MGYKYMAAFASVLPITISGAAQTAISDIQPLYRVDVIQRTIDAVDYQYKADPTQVDLKSTVLLPEAKGMAMVESKAGRTEIDARFDHLAAPSRSGGNILHMYSEQLLPRGGRTIWGKLSPVHLIKRDRKSPSICRRSDY